MIGTAAKWLKFCLITDRTLAAGRPFDWIVAEAVKGGITLLQLRDKDAPTRVLVEEARALKRVLAVQRVPLVINDRIDVALAAAADGVHLGQSDMPVALARKVLGAKLIIGLSITNAAEASAADTKLADYLGVGPIFPQSTKPDAAPPLGLEGLADIRRLTRKPIVAVGGISAENAPAVRSAGADGIAVVSAIMGAKDPRAAAAAFIVSG